MTKEETWQRLIELGAVEGETSVGPFTLEGTNLKGVNLEGANLEGRDGPHWLDSLTADLRWKPPTIMLPLLQDNLP